MTEFESHRTAEKEAAAERPQTDAMTTTGIYVEDEIPRVIDDERLTDTHAGETEYARLVGMRRAGDDIRIRVELFDGSTESIRFASPVDARLDGDLRELCYFLGLEEQDTAALRGELVPITRTKCGIELGALGLGAPGSNRREPPNTTPELSGVAGRAQRLDPALGFLEGILASSVALVLAVVLVVGGLLALVGVDVDAVLATVGAQLLVGAILLARSTVLDPS